MKPLFIAFTILLSLVLSSCSPSEPIDDCFGDMIDDTFYFYVQSEDGEDLLDSTNPNAYNQDSIKIYYRDFYRNYIYFFDKSCDCSRGFYINQTGNNNILNIMLSGEMFNTGTASLVIEWNSTDRDTIDTKFLYREGNNDDPTDGGYCSFLVWDRILYNGDTLATDWKSFYYGGIFEDYPTIIKEGNLLN